MGSLSLEARLLFVLGFVLGMLAIVVVPPLVTFDGPGHYYRSLQVARGEFRAVPLGPNRLGGTFARKDSTFVDLAWTAYWQHGEFGSLSKWQRWSAEAERQTGSRTEDLTNIAIESPLNHAGQAVGIRIAGLFGPSPLWGARIGSVCNLLLYLSVTTLTIQLLPGFRRGFLLFALSPLILLQAASISHDAINFSLPVLFLALVWRFRLSNGVIGAHGMIGLAVAAGALALLKPVAIAYLFCLMLIPRRAFGSRSRQVLTLLGIIGWAGLLWLSWNLAHRNLDIAAAMDPSRPLPATALHKAWAFRHPTAFLPVFGRFLVRDTWEQWPVFFGGVGGWVSPTVLHALSVLSVPFLVALVGTEFGTARRDLAWSLGLVAQSLLLLFGTCLVCWLALGTVGLPVVPGLGGRYLLLVYLSFFAGALQLWRPLPQSVHTWFLILGLLVNVAGALVILVPAALRAMQ